MVIRSLLMPTPSFAAFIQNYKHSEDIPIWCILLLFLLLSGSSYNRVMHTWYTTVHSIIIWKAVVWLFDLIWKKKKQLVCIFAIAIIYFVGKSTISRIERQKNEYYWNYLHLMMSWFSHQSINKHKTKNWLGINQLAQSKCTWSMWSTQWISCIYISYLL